MALLDWLTPILLGVVTVATLWLVFRRDDPGPAIDAAVRAGMAAHNERLERIRLTVDDKLHATLEQRLGESFRLVAERLDTVHRGLNDMRAIAKDVGSLNRVLTNVKTRGSFGEWQLGALLEDVMQVDQYAKNVETIPGTGARVEFAVRMPGRADAAAAWLPVDAKFPREDYERLLDAQERADAIGAVQASRAIEQRLRLEAKSIREKYLAPPHTTDYAILFIAAAPAGITGVRTRGRRAGR